ncbi:MAG TPA: DUF4253 domain-containing protein [Acidimicrobiales bacterium]|nr:DUF4253 domain-containing protein [Acidimicrobiales bacterium]
MRRYEQPAIEVAGHRIAGHGTETGLWVSDAPVEDAGAAWLTIARDPVAPGFVAVLIDESDGSWVEEPDWFEPGYLASDADADLVSTLTSWWEDVLVDEGDDGEDGELVAEETAPFGRRFPGLAPATTRDADQGAVQRAVVERRGFRLAVVAGETTADVPGAVGWLGAVNADQSPSAMSTVLRSWEQRFGARLVVLGRDTMELLVTRPPATAAEALPIAAEHYAFCFDNISQGVGSISDYSSGLVGAVAWSFWWD